MKQQITSPRIQQVKSELPTVSSALIFVEPVPSFQRHWYVSHGGSDDYNLCGGSPGIPCSSLDHVINKADAHDVVHVLRTETEQRKPFPTCSGLPPDIRKSLTFKGEDGRPTITRAHFCHLHTRPDSPVDAEESDLRLSYESVDFTDVELKLSDGSLTLSNCTFANSTVSTVKPCRHVQVHVSNCRWIGPRAGRSARTDPQIYRHMLANDVDCLNTELSIVETRLSWFVARGNQSMSVLVQDSEFVTDPEGMQHLGGLHLTFSAFNSRIVVRNSTFKQQVSGQLRYFSLFPNIPTCILTKATPHPTKHFSLTFEENSIIV